MGQAKIGNNVKVHFTGRRVDGEVFATSQGNQPLEFKIGDGTVLPGLDQAVTGMILGEKKRVTLPPHEGFGEQNESLILTIEKSHFPPGFVPFEGMELKIPQTDGSVVFFKILEIFSDHIKLDANHPLAGQTLTFDLELLEIA